MSDNITIARPYAKAVFLIAQATNKYAKWGENLRFLKLVVNNKNIIRVLQDPTVSISRKSKLIIDVCGKRLTVGGQNLVGTLAKYRRLLYLPELCELYEMYREEAEKTIKVNVISAVKIDATVQEKMILMLSKKINRQVTAKFDTSDKLIGGAVIKAKDMVINGSVQGRLSALQNFLVEKN